MGKARRTTVLGWRWRRRDNPLRRHSDRAEAWVVLATWVLATAGAIAAGLASALVIEDVMARSREEGREVSAVLLETAPAALRDVSTGATYTQVRAKVRWTDGEGTVHIDRASVRAGTDAGATATVWTDGNGHLIPTPMGPTEAEARAVLTGVGAAVGGGLVVLAGGRLVRLRIERRATELWAREWEQVGPRWGHRTG
jgi:hypothetical protein